MDTWDTVRARRNVRAFTEEPIPVDALDRIMEAAWRTPSGSNRQLWTFVLGSSQAGVMNQARAREVLTFPRDWYCGWVIALGYPADRPLAPIGRPNRKPLDEVVHRDRW